MFVEAKLITFSDTPFELADVIFEELLYSFRPRAFELFADRLQGSPKTTIIWTGTKPFPRVFPIQPSCVQLRFRLRGRTSTPWYLLAPNRGRYVGRIRQWGLG